MSRNRRSISAAALSMAVLMFRMAVGVVNPARGSPNARLGLFRIFSRLDRRLLPALLDSAIL